MTALRLAFKGTCSLVAIIIGCALFCWVLYNEFIARLPEYHRPPWAATFGIAPAMIGVGIYWGRQVIQQLRAQQTNPADVRNGAAQYSRSTAARG